MLGFVIHIHSSSNGFEVILEDARGHARAWNSFGVEMRAVNWTSWNACAYLSSALTAPSHNNARMNMSSAFAAAPASHRHAHRQYVAGVIAFLSFSSSSRETYRSLQKSSIGSSSRISRTWQKQWNIQIIRYPSLKCEGDVSEWPWTIGLIDFRRGVIELTEDRGSAQDPTKAYSLTSKFDVRRDWEW